MKEAFIENNGKVWQTTEITERLREKALMEDTCITISTDFSLADIKFTAGDETVITIKPDGKVVFADHLTPEEGSKKAWECVLKQAEMYNRRADYKDLNNHAKNVLEAMRAWQKARRDVGASCATELCAWITAVERMAGAIEEPDGLENLEGEVVFPWTAPDNLEPGEIVHIEVEGGDLYTQRWSVPEEETLPGWSFDGTRFENKDD